MTQPVALGEPLTLEAVERVALGAPVTRSTAAVFERESALTAVKLPPIRTVKAIQVVLTSVLLSLQTRPEILDGRYSGWVVMEGWEVGSTLKVDPMRHRASQTPRSIP